MRDDDGANSPVIPLNEVNEKITNDENNKILARLIQETARLKESDNFKKLFSSVVVGAFLNQAISEARQNMPKDRDAASIMLEDISPFIFLFLLRGIVVENPDDEKIELAAQAPGESWIKWFEENSTNLKGESISVLNRLIRAVRGAPTRKGLVFVKMLVDQAVAVKRQDIFGKIDEADGHNGFTPLMHAMLGLKENYDDKDSYEQWIELATDIAKHAPETLSQAVMEEGDYKDETPFSVFLAIAGKISRRDDYFRGLAQTLYYQCSSPAVWQKSVLVALFSNLKKNPGDKILIDFAVKAVMDIPKEMAQQLMPNEKVDVDFYRQFISIMLESYGKCNSQDDKTQLVDGLIQVAIEAGEKTDDYSDLIHLLALSNTCLTNEQSQKLSNQKPFLVALFSSLEKNIGKKIYQDIAEQVVLDASEKPDGAWQKLLKDSKFNGSFGRKFIAIMAKRRDQLAVGDKQNKLTKSLLEVYINNREAKEGEFFNPLVTFIKAVVEFLLEVFNKKIKADECDILTDDKRDNFNSGAGLFKQRARETKIKAAERVLHELDGEKVTMDAATQKGLLGDICKGFSRRAS